MMGVDQKVSGMTVLTQKSGCADENAGSSEAKHSKGRPSQRRNWLTEEQSRRRDSNGVGPHSLLCNVTPEEFTGGGAGGGPGGRPGIRVWGVFFFWGGGEDLSWLIWGEVSSVVGVKKEPAT